MLAKYNMKPSFLLGVPLVLLLGAAAPPALAPADPAAAARVRAHVEFLADDQLEGRATGSRGHEIAALYVASQFRALGLQPGGERGSWYQRVPFRRATHDGTPELAFVAGGQRVPLKWAEQAAVRPSVTERETALLSPLVFAGYGIRDSVLGIDDFQGLDLSGKTVVIVSGTPAGLDTEVAAHLGSQKARMAAEAGAAGLIEISRTGGSLRLMEFTRRSAVDWVDSSGEAGSAPRGLRLRMAVNADIAERMFQGAPQSLAAIRTALAKPGAKLRSFPLNGAVEIKARSKWEDFSSPAVIGRLAGADPALMREHVLLMGHLDHLGLKQDAKPGEDRVYNGALDNAAGVATMIEAAHAFAASPQRTRRSLLFIAHTGEELGLLGADYWAAHPTVPIADVAAAVDLDMPVPLYQFRDVVAFGAPHNSVARTVAEAGVTMGITVSPDPMPEQSIFVRSDHYPLARRGIPAILLFTGYGNGGKPIWDQFFANRYHSVRDDLSQNILWDAVARYADLNTRIARKLADDPQRPRWYKGSYFGDRFAPLQPKVSP